MDVDGEEEEEETEEDRKASDEDLTEKFEDKAFNCSVPLIKSYCDTLHLNRAPGAKKADLVETLISFLAEPSESLLRESSTDMVEVAIASSSEAKKKRGRPKSKTPTKKKRGRPKKKKDDEEEPDDLDFVSEDEAKAEEVKEEEPEYDDDDQDEETEDGKTIPSAKKLRTWVKAYVTCFDLDKCSAKHAIATASEKYGVDMTTKKQVIMQMIKEEM